MFSTHNDEPHDGYRQIAIVGVLMGDTNAVSVLEMAHRRQLVNAGVLRTDSLLLLERPLPQENEFFSILHFSRLHKLVRCPRAARARNMYVHAEFWSGALDGIEGTLGFPCADALLSCT